MLWDLALPGLVGLVAGLLYNQNNVAAEASPVTTRLEIEAGLDLCRMLGFEGGGRVAPWGHVTSGGTVANIEALWAAREPEVCGRGGAGGNPRVAGVGGGAGVGGAGLGGWGRRGLVELDTWTLLNLDLDVVAGIPAALAERGDRGGGVVARAGGAMRCRTWGWWGSTAASWATCRSRRCC